MRVEGCVVRCLLRERDGIARLGGIWGMDQRMDRTKDLDGDWPRREIDLERGATTAPSRLVHRAEVFGRPHGSVGRRVDRYG